MSSIRLEKNVYERKKKSLIKMTVVTAVLLVLCVLVSMSGDRTAPEFDFTNAASVYYVNADSDLSAEVLLEGVKATDNADGDLTDRIVVKSVRQGSDSTITVTYSVRDNSGNLTTQERIYNLSVSGNVTDITTSGNDVELAVDETDESTEETESADETAESQSEEAVESAEAAESEVQVVVDTTDTAETVADTDVVVVETEEVAVETSTSEPPVIALTTTEARIPTGEALRYNDYIAYLSDDVDTAETLQNYIWIEGYYDVDWNVPGVYTLIFRVTDSDGNLSDPQTLTVYVGQD